MISALEPSRSFLSTQLLLQFFQILGKRDEIIVPAVIGG